MARAIPESLHYFNTDRELAPDAWDVGDAWVKTGSQSPTFAADGLDVDDNNGSEVLTWHQLLVPGDGALGPQRQNEVVEVQGYVRGVADGAGWSSGASPIGFHVYDGVRSMMLSIGSTLQWINPEDGTVYKVIRENWDWTSGHWYRLRKEKRSRLEVWVDGELLDAIPYGICTASTATALYPARAGFGTHDASGTAQAIFESVEVSCNRALPPQWKVERAIITMLSSISSRWTEEARALLRATLGLIETPTDGMLMEFRERTADVIEVERHEFSGTANPEDEDSKWLLVNYTTDVQSGYLRIPGAGAPRALIRDAGLDVTDAILSSWDGFHVLARFTLRILPGWSWHTTGNTGLHIRLVAAGKIIAFTYWVDTVTEQVYAQYTNNSDTYTTTVTKYGRAWQIDPFVDHRIEMHLLGQDWVLMVIDGRIVDRVAWSSFANLAGDPDFRVAWGPGTPTNNVMLVKDAEHVIQVAAPGRRPHFIQALQERSLHVAGCERNDELELWARSIAGVQEMRGTTRGIAIEGERLSCDSSAEAIVETTQTSWYLDETFPSVTPIFLDGSGLLKKVYYEAQVAAANFTLEQWARIMCRYVFPASIAELQYWACYRVFMTANSVDTATQTTVTVAAGDTARFEVGQKVTLRDSGNTVQDSLTITSITSTTLVLQPAASNSYSSGDVVRLVLDHS